jgi:hypothetical protein
VEMVTSIFFGQPVKCWRCITSAWPVMLVNPTCIQALLVDRSVCAAMLWVGVGEGGGGWGRPRYEVKELQRYVLGMEDFYGWLCCRAHVCTRVSTPVCACCA